MPAKDDDKVFDVAKPGTTDPQTGSKPMSAGHKSVDDSIASVKKPEAKKAKKPAKKVKLEPLSEDMKRKDHKTAAPSDTSAEPDEPDNDDTAADDSVSLQQETAVSREDRLQQMIDSGEYRVNITEEKNFSLWSVLVVFLVTLCIGAAGVVLLVDAEILDIGINLPFDIL